MGENESENSDVQGLNDASVDFKSRLRSFAYNSELDKSTSTDAAVQKPASRPSQRKKIPTTMPLRTNAKEKRGGRTKSSSTDSSVRRKKRSTTKERSANDAYDPESNLVDSLYPNLILVFIGLNPGLTTAATGHAYAHRSNRFWHLLHESGITATRHDPSQTHDLPKLYRIGNTNICSRATRSGDGLTKEELEQGAVILEDKIAKFRPEAVCIVGKSIWETIWKVKTGAGMKKSDFKWGWQDEDMWLGRILGQNGEIEWQGARTFVATSTSGLAATLTPSQKLEIWKPLGDWVVQRRMELEQDKSSSDI